MVVPVTMIAVIKLGLAHQVLLVVLVLSAELAVRATVYRVA